MFAKDINQNEMIALAIGLHARGIKFNSRSRLGGLQICAKGWDAICNCGSYGHDDGLIEVMGLPQCKNDVLGFLTAEQILAMIDENNACGK